MRFGSVCSGIEAASVAWKPLGWCASFVSEIEAFPRAVLAHHYPETPLHGDFTTIQAGQYEPIDLLVGGTPCQSFSVAGLRGGLADDRGNLALEYLRLADRLRPRWLVWENVPGVLSSNGGRDFGAILGGMVELGYGFAYRVLDAQFFGLAQRRRRVFVVGYLGDWRPPAAVLFERESLSGHPAPRREARKGSAAGAPGGAEGGDLARRLRARSNASHREDSDTYVPLISPALKARDYKGPSSDGDGDGDGATLVAQAFKSSHFTRGKDGAPSEVAPPLSADADKADQDTLICFSSKDHGADAEVDLSPTLRAGGHDGSHANAGVPPAIAYGLRNDLHRSGEAKTPSADAKGRVRLRDAGFNPLEEMAPTLDAGAPHAIAFAIQERAVSENPDAGPDGAGFRDDGAAYTLEARSVPQAVAFALRGRDGGAMPEVEGEGDRAGALRAADGGATRDFVAFNITPSNSNTDYNARPSNRAQALTAGGNRPSARGGDLIAGPSVRRLTPVECARLQGFPDDYLTQVPWRGKPSPPDGPQYKALGNSMAVPVMAWIGRRIEAVDALLLAAREGVTLGEDHQ